ncbi:hypothetical protein ACJJIG_16085 [Microbulbifer sp. SSSA007]|uniref:hypothetical protein n=1 Tax=unclassified Microbulbifer TaxID=2619833 RepID=UPI00403A421F
MYTASSTTPAEDSLRSYERQQDSLPDEGAIQKAKTENLAADFFLRRILTKDGRLSRAEANCHSRFTEIANDELGEDELGKIFKLAEEDGCAAGVEIKRLAKQYAIQMAKGCREDLEIAARNTGYLDEREGF